MTRNSQDLARQKAAVEARHGAWTAHNIRLADELWTIGPEVVNFDEKTRRVVQIAHDFFGSDLGRLAVLDLGAGEGELSLELASRGAHVTCVEARADNLEKVRFVAGVLGLDHVELRLDDVRRLRDEQRQFDLVLCFGLLYHLDAPSVFDLVHHMGRLTTRVLVLDTHISLAPREQQEHDGHIYAGTSYREHPDDSTAAQRLHSTWSSLDNPTSFWLTRASLFNLLMRKGFSTVYEVAAPLVYDYFERATAARFKYDDRLTVVAVKSPPAHVQVSPRVDDLPPRSIPEDLAHQLVTSPLTAQLKAVER